MRLSVKFQLSNRSSWSSATGKKIDSVSLLEFLLLIGMDWYLNESEIRLLLKSYPGRLNCLSVGAALGSLTNHLWLFVRSLPA